MKVLEKQRRAIANGSWDGCFSLSQHDKNGDEYETILRPSKLPNDSDDCPQASKTWRTIKVMGADMVVQNAPEGRANRMALIYLLASGYVHHSKIREKNSSGKYENE